MSKIYLIFLLLPTFFESLLRTYIFRINYFSSLRSPTFVRPRTELDRFKKSAEPSFYRRTRWDTAIKQQTCIQGETRDRKILWFRVRVENLSYGWEHGHTYGTLGKTFISTSPTTFVGGTNVSYVPVIRLQS